jgi:hypothetical protein
MPKFRIAVEWEVCGIIEVEADSIDDAIEKVQDPDFPLPTDSDYIDDSFTINKEMTQWFAENEQIPVQKDDKLPNCVLSDAVK